LICCPSFHDGGVIYTVNDDLLNTSGLESFLLLKVTWYLRVGSGGSKGAWEANEDDLLSGAVIGDIDLLRVRKDGRKYLYRWNRSRYHGR
jgi:hypothetical protein